MEQELFSNLPSEIMMDILLRLLPVPMIARCKSVCKSWLNMIESREFCNSHLSKSVPGLYVFHHSNSKPYEIHKINTENSKEIINFNFNFLQTTSVCEVGLHSSVHGLLFLCSSDRMSRYLCVCNPITRECIRLPPPPSSLNSFRSRDSLSFGFGFGVSRMSGQYKIVRITPRLQSTCEVYTLGTGLWRSTNVACSRLHYCRQDCSSPLLNGNLHWLALDSEKHMHISCFDLETELYTTFSLTQLGRGCNPTLSVLEDCLCLCDYTVPARDVVIWVMKDYGDNESWTKEFIIKRRRPSRSLSPFKVFKDGDTLIFLRFNDNGLLFYSSKTKAIKEDSGERRDRGTTFHHTPSFLSLHKTFATEHVSSF